MRKTPKAVKSPAPRRVATKAKPTADTTLRAYRFDARLLGEFETDCVRHLRNPRAVLQALIRHWLDAGDKQRDAIAERYQQAERAASAKSEKPS